MSNAQRNRFITLLAAASCLVGAIALAQAPEVPTLGRPVPHEILDPPWLAARQQAQLATADDFGVFVGFRFEDRRAESGITFRNRVVEDAAITYKAVHYDHGNGLAVADVDGDGLYDLCFVNQVGKNELWRNRGEGRFEDITDTAGVGMEDRISVTASFADIDNDGDPDLYVTAVRAGNQLFENLGGGRFRDISQASGLGHRGHSSGAVFFDYDRDGRVDLFLTNVGQYTADLQRVGHHDGYEYRFYDGFGDAFGGHHFDWRTEKSLLFRNLGDNRFEDVTRIMGEADTGWSGDATAADLNADGWPDLYALNMQGQDQYYENRSGEGFVPKSRERFPKTSWGAMGIKAFDWNNDGDLDLFITDMHSDMSKDVDPGPDEFRKSDMQWNEAHLKTGGMSIFGNSFFENRGDGEFVEISDRIGVENYWPWGLSVGDLNGDGFQDAFVTLSMNYPFRYQTNTVLINDRAERFRAAEFILGVEPRRDRKTAQPWFDLDCPGEDGGHKLCAGAADRRVQVWSAVGSRSSVIFDLDNDGDLDIVTNEFNAEPLVLVSDLAQSDHALNWLAVRLVGRQSNRGGLGARVTVRAGDTAWSQVLDGKSGYLSQSLLPLYFGLGDATKVDEVQVEWPSGRRQTVAVEGSDRLIEVTEPADG
jgi:hypothetical protein